MEFRVLGPLEVVEAGVPIQLTARRQRTLLAALLLRAGRASPAEALIDAMWNGEPPASAASVLRLYSRNSGARFRRAGSCGGRRGTAGRGAGGARCRALRGASGRSRRAHAEDNPRLARSLSTGPRPLAWSRAGRAGLGAVRPRRGGSPGRAAPGVQRGALRRRPRARTPRRGCRRPRAARRRAPAARAVARAVDARPLPRRPPGGRTRVLPRRPRGARRGARARSGPRAAGAPAAHPAPGSRARSADRERAPGRGPAVPSPPTETIGRAAGPCRDPAPVLLAPLASSPSSARVGSARPVSPSRRRSPSAPSSPTARCSSSSPSLRDPDLLLPAIGRALGLREAAARLAGTAGGAPAAARAAARARQPRAPRRRRRPAFALLEARRA